MEQSPVRLSLNILDSTLVNFRHHPIADRRPICAFVCGKAQFPLPQP
jgi:hypothetical protein